MASASAPSREVINFSWLIRLRWAAVAGQLATIIGVAQVMQIALPMVPLLSIVAASAVSNVACVLWMRRGGQAREAVLGGVIAVDLLLFTGLLYFTGGPLNPFSFLFLVHIALGALVLGQRWMWPIVALAVVCFGLLFVDHVPLAAVGELPWVSAESSSVSEPDSTAHQSPGRQSTESHAGHHPPEHGNHPPEHGAAGAANSGHDAHANHDMVLHLWGMWVAFGIGACFIVYFIHRVTRSLADRERELVHVRELTARREKLASLATLSAGAAHELSTPLATIAVISKELERQLERAEASGETLDDVRTIREQVDRCREILGQMAAEAGESAGEGLVAVTIDQLLRDAVDGLPNGRSRVEVDLAGGLDRPLRVPRRALAQALRGVVKNAIEASPPDAVVEIQAARDGDSCRIEVADHGGGMEDETRHRATEPFFTTKEAGRGMGLGLFLTRAVVEQLGGVMSLESTPGQGTRVSMKLPLFVGGGEEDRAAEDRTEQDRTKGAAA